MTVALLKPEDAAAALSVTAATLANWRLRRSGPAFVRINRTVRYRREDLDAWIEAHRVKTAGGAA